MLYNLYTTENGEPVLAFRIERYADACKQARLMTGPVLSQKEFANGIRGSLRVWRPGKPFQMLHRMV